MTYLPILKARQGELKALTEWGDQERPNVSPVIEVTPWERLEEPVASQHVDEDDSEIDSAVKRIARAWDGKSATAFVDTAYAERDLGDEGWGHTRPVLAKIIERLRDQGLQVAPVLRASSEASYVTQVAEVLEADKVQHALVRVTAEDLDDSIVPLRRLVTGTADGLGLSYEHVSVLLDFGAVADEGAMKLALRLARFVLPQLAEDPWQSLAVAAGSFPVNLADVQAFSATALPRWDYRLWEQLRDFDLPVQGGLQFGDYGVTHPVLPVGAAFAAPPQLRYTQDRHWVVLKGKRQERRGHKQFYDICAEILAHLGPAAAGPEASWGDEYVHAAAEYAVPNPPQPATTGTGNASTWRAVATSHHLAHTADQLLALDAL